MKRMLSFFFCVVSYCISFSQPSVHDEEIMQIKGKWSTRETVNQRGDPALFSSQFAVLLKKTDTIATLLKKTYPGPTGLEAAYYSSINHSPMFEGGPATYELNSFFESYYFNTHLNKILKGTETETWVNFSINEFALNDFPKTAGDWMIDGKLTRVYTLWETEGTWKGFPVYKNPYPDELTSCDKAIIITRNGKFPFVPLSQKEYLLAMRYQLSEFRKNMYSPEKAEQDFQKSLDNIRNNKYVSAETKEKMISDMQKDHEGQMQSGRKAANAMGTAWDEKIKLIDDYLASHSDAEMQQPAVTTSLGDFKGHFGAEKNQRAVTPVRLNMSYFDKSLPRYLPQFISVRWTIGKEAPKIAFGKKFESDFPLDKLAQMVTGAKGDADWSNEPLVKGPDIALLRKRAERYADSLLKKKQPAWTIPIVSTKVVPKDTATGFKIPPRNERMLGAVPSKTLSSTELKTYLEGIDQKYTSILVNEGDKLPDVSTFSANAIVYAATMYLLDGASNAAAWCAIKAVEKDPDDVVVLNNSGGVLNACGFQPVAIAVLQTALEKAPGNSTLQNNIGQSYMGLGDITKAASYLQQALITSPYHPHANFSMACIEYKKGNNTGALSYVQKSLRGSFTDGAMHLFYKLKPNGRLWDILKNGYKPTDYFNEDKYHLPPQCENVNDVERLRAEYKGYREMVERVKKQLDDIHSSESELGEKSMIDRTKNLKSNLRSAPFAELGAIMVMEISLRLTDEQDRLARAQTIYNKEISDLYKEYNDAYSRAQSCAEQLALGNKYMEAMAAVTTEYQKTWLPVYRDYFNDYAFWGRVQSPDKHLQRAAYAAAARGYLAEILRLAETHFLNLCDPEVDSKKDAEDYVMKEPDCGIDIGMNLGIGSFRIDCEKMEYHFGGLLVADVVHTYRTHSTTIAIGAGLDLKFGGEKLKAGPIEGGFGATGKMQYFLTFDGTRPSDQGFIWEGAIEYEQKFNTELGTGIKKIDDVKTNSVDLSAKTILSIQNGFTSSGSVYEQLDKILEVKPEKQVNKNVKIFNSQK